MKNLTKLFCIILMFSLLIACSDDDKLNSDLTNYVSLNGQKYNLEKGFIEADGNGIHIISSGITFLPQLDDYSDPLITSSVIEHTGKGNLILLSDYDVNEDLSPKIQTTPLKKLKGGIAINYNFNTEENDYLLEFSALSPGTCQISKKDGNYEIIVSYTDENNNVIEVYYLGDLTKIIQLPLLTTSPVTNITQNSASCGGNVTFDGGSVNTLRGVCWGSSTNPTILLETKTTDGKGTGTFTSSLTGLTPSKYYVRAYATNSAGTSYGNEEIFTIISFQNDIQPIFSSNCINCHSGVKSPDLSVGKAFESLTAGGYINTLNPETSMIYLQMFSTSHNPRTNDVEKQKILDWVKQGALNN